LEFISNEAMEYKEKPYLGSVQKVALCGRKFNSVWTQICIFHLSSSCSCIL